jgi:hypothetical protein
MKRLYSAFVCAVLCVGFALPVIADPPKDEKPTREKGTEQVILEKYKSLPKGEEVAQYLQDISVTIKAGNSEGSGVITNVNGTNYVWTAGHVVAGLRRTRTVINPSGGTMTVVEFDDVEVVKDLVEDGRTVGSMRFNAEVVRYSDAEYGEDLALLRVRKKNLTQSVVHFYLDEKIPVLGTKLFHVGSLLGHGGSNSMTSGIVSQHGRVHQGQVYDQTTCAAFPGSSGGGVYLEDGRYCGMIVRGAGETFNLTVPARRITKWAKKVGVEFTLNPKILVPSDAEIKSRPIEDTPKGGSHPVQDAAVMPPAKGKTMQFNHLIRTVQEK